VDDGGVSEWSLFRRIISRAAQLIGLVLLPEVVGRVSDPMSGYFMLDRRTIAGRALNPTGYKILIEILARGSAIKISEIGYVFQERQSGESKVTAAIYLQYLQHLCRLRATLLYHSRFGCFCLVGLSGVVVDMTLLFFLSDPRMLHWGLTRSKLIAAEIAIVNNFQWNDAWTFADLTSSGKKVRRFLKFNVICVMGLVLNVALLNIQFNWLGINRYLANAIAILVATFWNYLLNKQFGWRSSEVRSAEFAEQGEHETEYPCASTGRSRQL
jgi:dolichol-phosphate mannosyltransferase